MHRGEAHLDLAGDSPAHEEDRIMRDDFLSDGWAGERHHLMHSIDAALRGFAAAFVRFHERRFEAPWRAPSGRGKACA